MSTALFRASTAPVKVLKKAKKVWFFWALGLALPGDAVELRGPSSMLAIFYELIYYFNFLCIQFFD